MPAHNPLFTGHFDNTLVFRDEVLDLNEVLTALDTILKHCAAYGK